MIGEAKIIVGAHVQHAFATGNGDVGILGGGNHPLGLEETLRFNFFECLRKLFFEFSDHMRSRNYKSSHTKSTTDRRPTGQSPQKVVSLC